MKMSDTRSSAESSMHIIVSSNVEKLLRSRTVPSAKIARAVHVMQNAAAASIANPALLDLWDNAPKCLPGKSPIHQYGLFAASDIAKNERILDFNDSTNFIEIDFDELSDDFLQEGHLLALNEQICLIAKRSSKFSLINHSREANSAVEFSQRFVYAKRDINVGEEITIDYRLEPSPPRVSAMTMSYI